MEKPSDPEWKSRQLRDKIIGLGESSYRKSYYPQLQKRLNELERFRALLDQSKECFFLVSLPDGRIRDLTLSVENQLGYSIQDLIGTQFVELVTSPPAAQIQRCFSSIENSFQGCQSLQVWLRAATGVDIPFEISGNPVSFNDERYMILVAHEIRARLQTESRLQSQMEHLNSLHLIDLQITSNHQITSLLQNVLELVSKSLKVDAAVLYTYDLHKNLKPETWLGFSKPLNDLQPDHLLQHRCLPAQSLHRLTFLPDIQNLQDQFCFDEIMSNEGFVAYAGIPLRSKQQMVGVLEIYQRTPFHPNYEWFDFLEKYAAQLAIAVDNGQMFMNLEKTNQDLLRAYEATLEGWAYALEMREHETSQHTCRVRELTVCMAREMGFDREALENISRGALLHDIGKMAIPDNILLKPGPLNDEEWQIMRKHPEMAFNMLSPIEFLSTSLDIPYCHHERYDGSGYPRGLKGEDIPLTARIFTIIDVWDALLSDRPYRKAWELEQVLAYMKENSGIIFDPVLLNIFFTQVIDICAVSDED
jgi:PAS domain S-box-containing protein/putative nucleotidyltransferase with HDIG domain